MSAEECARIASSVCSGDDLPSPPDVSSKDYALHVTSDLENELSKAPAAEFEIFLCSLVGFCPPTRSRPVFVLTFLTMFMPSLIADEKSKYLMFLL